MATELGKAYVQIMPSAKGISGEIQKTLDPEAKRAGKSAGSKMGSALKIGVAGAVAGVGAIIGKSISEGGDLEQSIGGIETLFKDHADTVRTYANEAYKTVGVSANDYMENVTSFSASLLQSMGGDTKEAAKVAHTAMVDMGDNANKMGTDMRDIQNAYQGFAKENYTMLDNLKLGYGGTKGEMERLLKDAQELTGVEYDISNLDDIFMAVHAIQQELGITGTTAIEAEDTITGSMAAMKSAFSNVLGTLAIGEDIMPSLNALAETVTTFMFNNLLPMTGNILKGLPDIIVTLIDALIENLPMLASMATELVITLVNGIGQALPILIPAALEAIMTIVEGLISNLPLLLDAAMQLIIGLGEGLIAAIPQLIERLPEIINSMIDYFISSIPKIAETGIKLLTSLIKNLPQIIVAIVKAVPKIIKGIVSGFAEGMTAIMGVGADLVKGLWEGIKSAAGWLKDKISGWIGGIVDGIKGFFKIGSPSKLFADEIGAMLPEGLAIGVEGNLDTVSKAMENMAEEVTNGNYDIDTNFGMTGVPALAGASTLNHTGIIRVEGVNNEGELTSVIDIVMDELRRQVRE
ncbi:MAG TPA: hypothetical protein VFC73_08825 [Syntrophomonadaceae bacterium]|nr:hypothetical protein [Syntrophomonadaceae bacterium]